MPASDNPNAGSATELFPIKTKPGIQRDGTEFDSDNWVDGRWTRWQNRRARKMGGYRMVANQLAGPIRQVLMHPAAYNTRVYCGSAANLQFIDLQTSSGIGAGVVDVTPSLASGFVPSNLNTWQFAELYDATGAASTILAHAAPNIGCICNTDDRKVFYSPHTSSSPFADSTAPAVSGGVCANAPYAIVYGDDGYVAWCVPNEPTDWTNVGSGEANITKSKIVWGSAVRGGAGQAPAFLFLSVDAVIRATFNGGSTVFDFDQISTQSSILSSAGVIEYDGVFFWAGVDRFLMYNGVVQEVPNNMNINFFFENLNWNQRQKVWATKVPRYGEIWWLFPRGNSEECNHAIVLNLREQIWYDTPIDRSAGYFPQVFRWPLWAAVEPSESPSSFIRPLTGTAATSDGGTAANAFDGDPATDCTQVAPDGNISFDYGADTTKPISRVGILPNGNQTLNLVFEYSDDNAATWTTAVAPGSVAYVDQVAVYYDLTSPISARAWRVRETDGGTLDLAEVYFLSNGYMLMQHEFGVDAIIDGVTMAIDAYVETNSIDYISDGPLGDRWLGVNRQVILDRIEPDLDQIGNMTVDIIGRRYARDEPVSETVNMIPPTIGSDGLPELASLKMDMTQQFRIMRLRFRSNILNGFFFLGNVILKIKPGDRSE
jgi:hypothetical protein